MAYRFGDGASHFGVEIEFYGDKYEVLRAMRLQGISVEIERYNHETRDHWKIVSDGSLRDGGWEVVSPPLPTNDDSLREVKVVMSAIRRSGGRIDKSCGFHVHLDGSRMTTLGMRNIIKLYARYEETLDLLMPKSRRGASNRFCVPVCRSSHDPVDEATKRLHMNAYFDQLDAARSMERLQRIVPGWDGNSRNYCKLNVGSFWRHGTIEFRHHSATLDGEKAAHWIRLCDAMMAHSLKVKWVQRRWDDGRNARTRFPIMADMLMDADLRKFYSDRLQHFTPTGNLSTRAPADAAA